MENLDILTRLFLYAVAGYLAGYSLKLLYFSLKRKTHDKEEENEG